MLRKKARKHNIYFDRKNPCKTPLVVAVRTKKINILGFFDGWPEHAFGAISF